MKYMLRFWSLFVLKIICEDAGGTFDFGGAGTTLVVLGGARGGYIARMGFLVAFEAKDFGTDEATVVLLGFRQQFLDYFIAGRLAFSIAALRLSAVQSDENHNA